MSKKFDIDINFKLDTSELESAQKMLKELVDSDDPDLETHVDDSEIKTAQDEFDSLKGEKADTEVHVDDSEIKNAQKEIEDLRKNLEANTNSMGNTINGVVSGLAGKSIWDTVYGTSAKAETNKVLIKNMGDTSEAYTDLYNTIDKTTDNSLISMQQLIPAMNGIKSATGATAKEIDAVTPGVANFGQYVYAMSGSSAKAEQAMFDLSKGIKGAYASLDQYGITEDALMRTGLWSGKEDDIEGYIAAVNEVTGSTDDLMNTATGMEALMGKSFSRAGKRIGESVLPAVKTLLGGFNDLDAATNGWASTAILIGGSIGSSVVGGLSAFNQAKQGYDALKGSIQGVRDAMSTAKAMTEALRNAESISEGVRAALSIATGAEAVAEEGAAVAKGSAIAPTTGLAIAENSLLLPVLLVAAAIIALIAILWYLYNNNETVRQGIDNLIQQFQQFMMKLQIVKNIVIMFVQVTIGKFMEWVNRGRQAASNLVNNIYSTLSTLPSRVSSAISGVTSALTKPFSDAYGQIKPYIDKIQSGINTIGGWFSGIGFEGFDSGTVGYEGFSGTLNDSFISSTSSNNSSITNNFNINGIIEEEASQYIVDSVNGYMKKQNLIRGV